MKGSLYTYMYVCFESYGIKLSADWQADGMLTSKLTELSDELRRTQTTRDELARDVDKMADGKKQAEQEVMSLKTTLQSLDSYRHTADERIRDAEAKLGVSARVLCVKLDVSACVLSLCGALVQIIRVCPVTGVLWIMCMLVIFCVRDTHHKVKTC